MDWSFVHRAWDKWASANVGSSGEPLKAALLINFDPTGPSRLLSTVTLEKGWSIQGGPGYSSLDGGCWLYVPDVML